MSIESDRKRIVDLVSKAADDLSEHVDTVQIIVTYHRGENSETECVQSGVGNQYARVQSCREYVMESDEYVKEFARRKQSRND